MIVDGFQMDAHYDSWSKRWNWDIKASYSDMKMEFSVGDEDIQDIVRYNFEMFGDMIKEELTERFIGMWDKDEFTDDEKKIFLELLGRVIE